MPAPQVKICGLKTPDALDAVVKARADYGGLVFHPPSPRNLTPSEAATLSQRAEGRVRLVGLFVNASDETLAEIVGAATLSALQFQGSESPERVAQISARFGLPVWKALPVAGPSDVARADAYKGAADLVLFDAKTPKGTLPGGMGLSFDWSLLSGLKTGFAWGLAGGLTSDNVGKAITQTGAPLVDVSSGVESAPGVKDVDRIAAFCKAALAL